MKKNITTEVKNLILHFVNFNANSN